MSTESLLARAAKYLETVSFLLERDPESSVSRSYYAMFFVAKALLNVHGIRTRTHNGLHRQFSKHFIKTDLLPEKLAKYLGDAFDARLLSDYADNPALTQHDAEVTLESARIFVDHIRQFLKASP